MIRAALTAKFTDFVDKEYLPWAETNKLSWKDDKRRCESLKAFFGNQPMREINPLMVERFKSSVVGLKPSETQFVQARL